MKRRRLTPEDEALWTQVTASVERLEKPKVKVFEPQKELQSPASKTFTAHTPIPQFRVGGAARERSVISLGPTLKEALNNDPVHMDKKRFGQMKRGKLRPEARIDLHGMTLAEAHPALTSFVMSAHSSGKRLALVITGKGKDRDDNGPIPTRFGVLRHQVPQWLRMPPLSNIVMQVSQAHISHGGEGAYYIYLRKPR